LLRSRGETISADDGGSGHGEWCAEFNINVKISAFIKRYSLIPCHFFAILAAVVAIHLGIGTSQAVRYGRRPHWGV